MDLHEGCQDCNSLLLLNKPMLMENYLACNLFTFNIFGGLCGDPEKTPGSSEPGEQTGEAFAELIDHGV